MKHLAKIFLGVALAAAPLAYATPITGTIGFGGNGTYNGTTFTPGANNTTTNSNGYVNVGGTGTLNMFTFLNPATFYSFSTSTIGTGEQVFTTVESGKTLSFTLKSVSSISLDAPGAGFVGAGTLSETGFDDTAATFTLNTNAGAGTFITFNTATAAATPEPSSLVLLGSGLVSAAGMLLRRRRIA